jgi:hypothetical protein
MRGFRRGSRCCRDDVPEVTQPKLSRGQRVDWFRVLADLKRAGLSTREVARRLTLALRGADEPPVAEAHLRYYSKDEGEPRWSVGFALILLWREVTGTPGDLLENVPLRRVQLGHRVSKR